MPLVTTLLQKTPLLLESLRVQLIARRLSRAKKVRGGQAVSQRHHPAIFLSCFIFFSIFVGVPLDLQCGCSATLAVAVRHFARTYRKETEGAVLASRKVWSAIRGFFDRTRE